MFRVCDAWRSYSNLKDQLVAAIVGCQRIENSRKLLGVELDCNSLLAPWFSMVATRFELDALHSRYRKTFSTTTTGPGANENGRRTINDCTDHSMYLSILCGIGGCITCGEGWGEVLLERLEGAADSGRPAQARAERSLDATASSN